MSRKKRGTEQRRGYEKWGYMRCREALHEIGVGGLVVFDVGFVGWLAFFFFQVEDGIRDRDVTGAQTCALPISARSSSAAAEPCNLVCGCSSNCSLSLIGTGAREACQFPRFLLSAKYLCCAIEIHTRGSKIGRATCRERVDGGEVGGAVRRVECR